jgi:hypothetical protein
VTADEALEALLRTFYQLLQILPSSKSTWDDDEVIRSAVERPLSIGRPEPLNQSSACPF